MTENNSSQTTMAFTEWDPMPSYWKVAVGIANMYNKTIEKYKEGSYRFPANFQEDLKIFFSFSHFDIALMLCLAVGFTLLRSVLSTFVIKPLGRRLALTEESTEKMPESIWKFLYYGSIWFYAFRVLVTSGEYRFFQNPSTVWDGFNAESDIPTDIYVLYAIQGSFYLHGLYALFFLDAWRKDSTVMGAHHVVTIVLIWCSYVCRLHNIGSLVMLFHDFCDIELEFAKINVYLKVRNGKTHKLNDILAAVSFLAMTVTWFISRLYYFPLKVLYASSSVLVQRNLFPDYTMLMNTMLLLLTAMNIFWFWQMIAFLYKILTGELQEVDDIREYDVVEKLERTQEMDSKKSKKVE